MGVRPCVVTLVLAAMLACGGAAPGQPPEVSQPFRPGGLVTMHLSAGEYTVEAGRDNEIHVRWNTRNVGDLSQVKVSVQTTATDATIKTDGPHNGFSVTIELPARSDLDTRLSAGELRIDGIEGSKRVRCWAGDLKIDVVRADDYGDVRASVVAGEIVAPAFHVTMDGLFRSLETKGPGAYSFDARLTAGSMRLYAARDETSEHWRH
ncbi:MAG: hypothetical protein ACHQQS_10955 [Thermoanaerobaculales bacterium]